MTTSTYNNSIILSRVKGNLTDVPTQVQVAKDTGNSYCAVTIACNEVTKERDGKPAGTWYPRVIFLGECANFAQTLSKGDFIEITNAILNPGELQDPWKDPKTGKYRPQNSALIVSPLRAEHGVTIPVKVIKKRVTKNTTETNQQDMFQESSKESVSSLEQEVVADIVNG